MNRPTRITFIGFGVCLLFLIWHQIARSEPMPWLPYTTIDCVFSKNVVTTLEKGKLQTAPGDKDFTMTFSGFNQEKAQATLIGNAGSDQVIFIPGDRKIMLIQITPTGNGSMTSIAQPSRDGEWTAFHTRHMWLTGEPIVSHYYAGRCRARN